MTDKPDKPEKCDKCGEPMATVSVQCSDAKPIEPFKVCLACDLVCDSSTCKFPENRINPSQRQPTVAAMKAAEAILGPAEAGSEYFPLASTEFRRETLLNHARVIDDATGLPELIAACEHGEQVLKSVLNEHTDVFPRLVAPFNRALAKSRGQQP